MVLVQCFNGCVGVISDFTGVSYEPEKGERCFNIKAAMFNFATLSLIYGIGLMIFSNPLTGLTVSGISLVAKIFVHVAMDQTFLGRFHKGSGGFFYKPFIR